MNQFCKPSRALGINLVIALVLLLSSCDAFKQRALELPATPSITGNLGWILVKESYARLRTEARADSAEAGHLRDGSILAVEGREYGRGLDPGSRVFWYLVKDESRDAWVSGEDVEVFESREQALRIRDARSHP